jgi:hypothetical protein
MRGYHCHYEAYSRRIRFNDNMAEKRFAACTAPGEIRTILVLWNVFGFCLTRIHAQWTAHDMPTDRSTGTQRCPLPPPPYWICRLLYCSAECPYRNKRYKTGYKQCFCSSASRHPSRRLVPEIWKPCVLKRNTEQSSQNGKRMNIGSLWNLPREGTWISWFIKTHITTKYFLFVSHYV